MKYIISTLAILISFFFSFCHTEKKAPQEKPVTVTEITFNFIGDLMMHSPQRDYAKTDSGYDFNPVFEYVRKTLQSADFTVGNLETVVNSEKPYSGYPCFNSPEEYLKAIKSCGFDLLYLANNHIYDYGSYGLESTIKETEKYGFLTTGYTVKNDSLKSYRIVKVKGVKIGFPAYTYGTNLGAQSNKSKTTVNVIDSAKITNDIRKIREMGAELIIVYFHFGNEYQRTENNYQRKTEEIALKAGADIIIASHPHVIQPVRFYSDSSANIDTGFTAYSLGNFISNQRWRYSDCGIILNFSISRQDISRKFSLGDVKYLPVWVYKGNTGEKREYKIISQNFKGGLYPEYISKKDSSAMIQSFNDTRYIITKYSDKIMPLK
ncbi:MAG: CapA family protein [Ignavibacteria bacterium]|nr:CapA family protein [Ignavibacteria bacterium]